MSKISAAQIAIYAVDELEKGITAKLVAAKLASYLLDARRSRELPKVMRAVELELNRRDTPQVMITSAHKVEDSVKTELANLLGVKNPIFTEVIDSTLIGGVKAKSGETEIDLTVRARLQNFKASIVKAN